MFSHNTTYIFPNLLWPNFALFIRLRLCLQTQLYTSFRSYVFWVASFLNAGTVSLDIQRYPWISQQAWDIRDSGVSFLGYPRISPDFPGILGYPRSSVHRLWMWMQMHIRNGYWHWLKDIYTEREPPTAQHINPLYIHGYPWISRESHGYPWIFIYIYGNRQYPMKSMDINAFHGLLCKSMRFHRYQWNCTDCKANQLISIAMK